MVENCFLRGTAVLVSGNGGVGKSLLMQQLATSAVLGRPWLGLHVKPGRAAILACEDDEDELHRRQWSINRHYQAEMPDVLDAGLDLLPRVTRNNLLMEIDRDKSSPTYWHMKRTTLMTQLVTRCRRLGIQYLIVDTVARTFGGQVQNAAQVIEFVDEMRRLAILIGGVVILMQHPSQTGRSNGSGMAGSTQWEDATRGRLYIHRHQAHGLVIEGLKSNYAAKMEPVKLEWRRGVFERIEPPAPRNWTDTDC